MLLAFSGVVVLMGASLDLAPQHLLGDALALLAAVFYAGYQLTLKHLRGALQALGGVVVLFGIVMARRSGV